MRDHRKLKPRRKVVLALCAVALALVPIPEKVAGAHTTQGSATLTNYTQHPKSWQIDGCSSTTVTRWLPPPAKNLPNINSLPDVFDFYHACAHHDGCYKGFPDAAGKPTYWVSQQQCDDWFLGETIASCHWQHGRQSTSKAMSQCLDWANLYYFAVHKGGGWGPYKGPNGSGFVEGSAGGGGGGGWSLPAASPPLTSPQPTVASSPPTTAKRKPAPRAAPATTQPPSVTEPAATTQAPTTAQPISTTTTTTPPRPVPYFVGKPRIVEDSHCTEDPN